MKGQYRLFNGKTVKEYTTGIYNAIKNAIESMSDDKILNGDFDTWVQYYVDRYTIQPIEISIDEIPTLTETKIKARNICRTYYNTEPGYNIEPEFYNINGYEIVYKVIYTGDFRLLSLQPDTRIIMDYQVSDFVEAKDEKAGSFSFCMHYAERDLLDKEDDVQAYVNKRFKEEFESYQSMIGYVNQEIGTFNIRLKNSVIYLLNERKNKAKNKNKLCNLLHIPIKVKPDAPNINPVPINIIKKTYVSPPNIVKQSTEFCVSDHDYEYIMKVIHNCCSVMQETVRSSSKYDEEELRDHILATLGTHFQNNVWGETFRREGKTDILIPFKNKAAFIAECKIWHGIRHFEGAVKQLFSYSTWKDIKVAVIVFNKKNKDFTSVLKVLEDWIKKHTKNYTKQDNNCWKCVIPENERNINFLVTICIYDLSTSV